MASDEPKAKRIKLEEKKLRYSKHKHRLRSVDPQCQACVVYFVKHGAVSLRALLNQRSSSLACHLKSMCWQLSVFSQRHIVVSLARNVLGIFTLNMSNADECS